MSPLPCPDPGRRGTSLIELLGALTAAAVLVLALLEGVSAATEAWHRQIGCLGMEREARTALRLLQDDWQSRACLPQVEPAKPDWPGFWVETPNHPGASSRLAFLRTEPARRRESAGSGGDLCLVLYDVVCTPDGGASSAASRQASPKLVRRVFDTAETYQRLRAHQLHERPLLTEADWQSLRRRSEDLEPLAHDVVRFLAVPQPATAADAARTPLPAHLDLTLRVTHRAMACRLNNEADWRGEGAHAQWLHQNTPDDPNDDRDVRTYTLRLATR
jgi:hypothetical protein